MHREELQVDGASMAVVVANVGDAGSDFGGDAELFIELACQRLLRAFAGLDLAAGKLPLQGHGLVGPALADQHFAAADDERGRHKTKGGSGRPRVGFLALFHPFSVIATRRPGARLA